VGTLGGLLGLGLNLEISGEGQLIGTDFDNPVVDSADGLRGESTQLCLQDSEALGEDPFASLVSGISTTTWSSFGALFSTMPTSPPLRAVCLASIGQSRQQVRLRVTVSELKLNIRTFRLFEGIIKLLLEDSFLGSPFAVRASINACLEKQKQKQKTKKISKSLVTKLYLISRQNAVNKNLRLLTADLTSKKPKHMYMGDITGKFPSLKKYLSENHFR
jgi:hypothetical protein